MRQYVWLNGRQVQADRAAVPVTDRGFLYGDGIFDTMLAQKGAVFRMDAHLERLAAAGTVTGIRVPDPGVLKKAAAALLKKNGCTDGAYVRITVTRGSGGKRLAPDPAAPPTVLIAARPQAPVPAAQYRTGLRTCIVTPRRNAQSLESRIKSLNYLPNVLGKAEADAAGCAEGIMLNEKGYVACGTVSNIFFIKDGALITPPLSAGILPGITRRIVIDEIAPALGMEVRQRNVRPAEIRAMEEAFVTNSLWGVMPVHRMDGRRFRMAGTVLYVAGAYRRLPDS